MSYEISKFPFKAELASASFNAKFEEIETYINNLSSEVETLRTENQELRQLLNNKVGKSFENSPNINLQNGWTGSLKVFKNTDLNLIWIYATLTTGTKDWATIIANIQANLRPLISTPLSAYGSDGKAIDGIILINSGDIRVYNPAVTSLRTGESVNINHLIKLG